MLLRYALSSRFEQDDEGGTSDDARTQTHRRHDPHPGDGAAALQRRVRDHGTASSPSTGSSTAASTSRWGSATARSPLAPADRLDRPPLVRLHSECLTGDVFGSQRCDCGPQLREAVERIARGRRLPALPAPGGARHRALRQARRLRAPGRRPRHLRGQRRAGLRRRRARLHGGGADAGGARASSRVALLSNNPDKAAQLRPARGRPSREVVPTGVHLSRRQRPLPRDQGAPRRAHPRPRARHRGRTNRSWWCTVTRSAPADASARRRCA